MGNLLYVRQPLACNRSWGKFRKGVGVGCRRPPIEMWRRPGEKSYNTWRHSNRGFR